VPAPAPKQRTLSNFFSFDIIFIAMQGGFCTVAGKKRRKGVAGAGTAMSSGQVAASETLNEADCKKTGNAWTKVSGTLSTY